MNKAARFALLLLPALFPISAEAKFQFENVLVEVQPDFGADRVTGVFRFKNVDGPGTVKSIETSCGCLSAKSDKTTYAAGESGQVEAVFNIHGLSGSVERSISFVSATKGEAPVRLAVRVHVPTLIEIEPKMLGWTLGEPVAPKRVKITMKGPDPINIKSISSTRRTVGAALVTVQPGRVYEIEVTPETTSESLLGMVRIETDARFRDQQKQMAFYKVEKPQ